MDNLDFLKFKRKLFKITYFASIVFLMSFIINTSFISAINFDYEDQSDSINATTNDQIPETKLLNPDYNENLTLVIYDKYLDILPNGEDVLVSAHLTYQNNNATSIRYVIHNIEILTPFVESRISSISVYDALGYLYYEWEITGINHLLNITLREPLDYNHFTTISVTYLIENAIYRSVDINDNFIMQWTLTMFYTVEQFSLVTTLPSDFVLTNQSEIPALVPDADYKSIDNRRFEWNFFQILQDTELSWIIRFQFYREEIIPVTFPVGKIIGGIVGALLVGILIGGLIVFVIFKTRTDSERKEIVESLLSDPEKEILRIIKGKDGVTTQSNICSETEFSKAKVSYYLAELEKKGIIARERWGRMNRVRIIADSYDKVYFDKVEKNNTKNENK